MSDEPRDAGIKPYSPGELARIYGVSVRTFNRWIKRHETSIGARDGLFYTALQVKIIFEKIGLPEKFEDD